MTNDQSSFSVVVPEMGEYRRAGSIWRVFFILFWILSGYDIIVDSGIPDWLIMGALGLTLIALIGFVVYGSRRQKRLGPVINREFAKQFTEHTGFEYPSDVDVMDVRRTFPVHTAQGSVVLWG